MQYPSNGEDSGLRNYCKQILDLASTESVYSNFKSFDFFIFKGQKQKESQKACEVKPEVKLT